MCVCACTLLLSRWEATLQSIISESSCTDQFTLCLVIIFRALWSASSCAGSRFLGSLKTHHGLRRQILACRCSPVAAGYLSSSCGEL